MNTYSPDYAVHPGETLKELMEPIGMNASELSKLSGIDVGILRGLISCEPSSAITVEISRSLDGIFDVPGEFWLNLQKNYERS